MEGLHSHMDAVHPLVVYECAFCRYKGKIKHLFQRHIKRVHEKQSDKICEFCGKSFIKSYHLRVHRMRHHGVEDPTLKVFRCDEPGCKYETFAMNILETHKQRHDKEKPFSCTLCSKKLKTQRNLEKHMKKIHERIRPFICEICGVDYGEESELKLHMVRHDEARHFSCQMCDYTTYSKSILESHMYVKHKVKLGRYKVMLKCDDCDFETPNPGKMEEHTNAHKNIRPHQCDQCDKAFFTKPTLKEHKKWVHDKATLNCPYCLFTAPVKSHLKKHIRVLHTHRDLKPYKCFYCDYRCNVSGNCRKHIVQKHKGVEIKWVKVCEPPIPSIQPEPGEITRTITNTGDTYFPKRGKKRFAPAPGSVEDKKPKSSPNKPKQVQLDLRTATMASSSVRAGNTDKEEPPEVKARMDQGSNEFIRQDPGAIDNQRIDAASTLARLSKMDVVQNMVQQGGGNYGIWQAGSLANNHGGAAGPSQANMTDNSYHNVDPNNQTVGAQSYADMCSNSTVNHQAYIETLTQATLQNYMASMAQQQGQGLGRGRPILPNFQSILASETFQRNQMQGGGNNPERQRGNMPDVVPSSSNVHIEKTE